MLVGAQPHTDHVGPGLRLAHGQSAHVLAADQLGEVAASLLVGAVAGDLVDTQIGVGTIAEAHAGRAAGDFLHDNGVGQVAEARAAVLFGRGYPKQTQVTQPGPQVAGEFVGLVDVSGRAGPISAAVNWRTVPRMISTVSPKPWSREA